MQISCVLAAYQLNRMHTDLIVFPEGILLKEVEKAQLAHPESIIVGAIEKCGRSCGLLLHRGQNKVNYLKVETDGRTKGSGNLQQNPVYQSDEVCIGVLICKDVDHVEFSHHVIAKVRSSSAKLKLICIPADMGIEWFGGDKLQSSTKFDGTHVILCNHTRTHPQDRCKSFVTDTHGTKIKAQEEEEPIHRHLP